MSNPGPDPAVVERWLQAARADLAYAEMTPPVGVGYEQACFHAQQAAEKALKALLLHYDQEPPYVHNIQVLLDRLAAYEPNIGEIAGSAALTSHAVLTRYPSSEEPVAVDEWKLAAALALQVVEWVSHRV
ncbi:MAG: HEPN domain-containing protein [Armatimonadia bacterium]